MAENIQSTQGKKLSIAVQTGFNVPNISNMVDIHLEGDPTVETPVGVGVKPDTMNANPFLNNKEIINNQASDSAVVCTSLIRQSIAGGASFLKMAYEAGGYSVNSIATSTTVKAASTPAAGVFEVTDATGMVAGMGINVQLDDGSFCPALIGSMSGDEVRLAMELPSIPAVGNTIGRALTITPNVMTKVPNNKLLTIVNGTNVGTTQCQDCALVGVGDIAFTPNEKIMQEFTFGASDKSKGDVATTHNNSFADGNAALVTHQPWCQIANSNSDYATPLPAAYMKLITATITPNITAEQMIGFGDANCKNNIQGWMQKGGLLNLKTDMYYDPAKIDEYTNSGNVDKYIGIIQPGNSELDPSVGFFAPKAHQEVAPVADFTGNNEHRVAPTYTVNPAEISGTTDADLGNQPWYLVVGEKSP